MTRTNSRLWVGAPSTVALGFFAALTFAPAPALADTATNETRPLQPLKGALADALGGEREALRAFATTPAFARAAGLEPIEADTTEDGLDHLFGDRADSCGPDFPCCSVGH